MTTPPPVRVEDGKIYIGRMLVATYTGDVAAGSVSVIQQAKVRTVQEQIRDNINARLRDLQKREKYAALDALSELGSDDPNAPLTKRSEP